MEDFSTLEVLKQNLNTKEFTNFINTFNNNRIVLDEGNEAIKVITSTLMENWNDDCTRFIIENGYNNPSAVVYCIGIFINGYGTVYALYDSEFIECFKAKEFIERYIEDNIKHNYKY